MSDLMVRFRLVAEDADKLRELASRECRTPRQQALFLVRQGLDQHDDLELLGCRVDINDLQQPKTIGTKNDV